MKRQSASLDASFWISAHKSGLIDHLLHYFVLFAATAVIQEIEFIAPGLTSPSPAGLKFCQWRRSGHVSCQDPSQPVDWFHPGENAAIALAREHGYVLLIDDQAPYHFTKSQGLRSVASTDFTVLLYADNVLSYENALSLLTRSGAAIHLKRAAMTALAHLSEKRSQ
jgi:predicted nucleic acid-binding protein